MTKAITPEHKHHLETIKKNLSIIGSKEANFLKIELLFYEAMEVARQYGDEVNENKLLAALKEVQANEYKDTKTLFKKSSQREQVIRKFIAKFRSVLSASNKNLFFTPLPSQS
jgi:hypothetical protein